MICYPDHPTLAGWIAHARAMYAAELGRLPDASGLANWITMAAQGMTGDEIRAWMRTTPEWIEQHTAPPASVVDVHRWCGAFCIPDVFFQTGIPFGDETRLYTPALLCYDSVDRTRIYRALQTRGYTHVPILVSGLPYGHDYPEIPEGGFDAGRTANVIHEMQAAGFVPVLAFDDRRGPDCAYLAPLAALTQDGPLVVMGPYEINDGNRPVDDINSILLQKFALWPGAVQAVHFTPGHGAGDSPEWDWWKWARTQANVTVSLGQEAQFDDPVATGAAFESTALRLAGLVGGSVPAAWGSMADTPVALVRFEQTTTRTYHGQMTEAQQVAFDDTARTCCRHTIGFCDGGTP